MKSRKPQPADHQTPAPRQTRGANAPEQPARRHVLAWLWGGLLVALLGEATWITTAFLRPRRQKTAPDSNLFIAGPAERFAPDTVTAFPAGKFYLARLASGGFLALDRTCTHLGCTVPWDAEQRCFQCPCHASTFDITGNVLAPPAPRPLDLLPVRIENGIVKVDTGQRIRRRTYEAAQEARA